MRFSSAPPYGVGNRFLGMRISVISAPRMGCEDVGHNWWTKVVGTQSLNIRKIHKKGTGRYAPVPLSFLR